VVGSGTVEIVVDANSTVAALVKIYDTTGAPPVPDHGPILTSVTVSKVNPLVGDVVEVSAQAVDPDRDDVRFAWTSTCADSPFADAAAARTTWTASKVGPCKLTVTATAKQLGDSWTANLVVYPASGGAGAIALEGVFVPHPVIGSVFVSRLSYSGPSTSYQIDRFGNDGTVRLPLRPGQSLHVAADGASPWSGEAEYGLTDDCGGTIVAQGSSYSSSFKWTAPATAGVCILTVSKTVAGLVDRFPIALVLSGCADDDYEPNQTPSTLGSLPTTHDTLYANDADWYWLSQVYSGPYPPGMVVTVTSSAPLSFDVASSDGTVLASGTSGAGVYVPGSPYGGGSGPFLHVKAPSLAQGACGPSYSVRVSPAGMTGTVVDTYVTPAGEVQVPEDLSAATVELIDAQGNRTVGAGDPSGRFWFPSATYSGSPASFTLQVGTRTRIVSSSYGPQYGSYDLGRKIGHRADLVAATVSTPVTIAATGLSSWADGDELAVLSSAGSVWTGADLAVPAAGDTAATLTLDLLGRTAGLVDTTKGDALSVTHLAQFTAAGGTPYRAAVEWGTVPSLTAVDGRPANVELTLSPVARNATWTASVDYSLYAPYTGYGPSAAPLRASIGLRALPSPQQYAGILSGPDLLVVQLATAASGVSPGMTTFTPFVYGNAFPGTTPYAFAERTFQVDVTATGATTPLRTVQTSTYAGPPAHPVAILSPVWDLRFANLPNGYTDPMLSPVTNAALTPQTGSAAVVLSWSAGSAGTVYFTGTTSYRIAVDELGADALGETTSRTVKVIGLDGGSPSPHAVAIPAGVLTPGKQYVFSVTQEFRGTPYMPGSPTPPPGPGPVVMSSTTVTAPYSVQ
jgi:hypothetical protein